MALLHAIVVSPCCALRLRARQGTRPGHCTETVSRRLSSSRKHTRVHHQRARRRTIATAVDQGHLHACRGVPVMRMWRSGDRAYYRPCPKPGGATWNPPPPGFRAPTIEEARHSARVARGGWCVIETAVNGLPVRARFTDGVLFDPSMDIDLLLSLIHISEPTRLLSISYAVFC